MENQLVVTGKDELLSVEQVKRQVGLIQEIMQGVMKENEHYGIIPGCNKPSLLKAGAEKLGLTFRFRPEFEIREVDLGGGHIDYRITCRLYHIPTGNSVGEGVGSCSTKEGKYRFRNANYKCPECGQESIIKGKKEYGGGWLCWKNKGGCGAKWQAGDPAIESQQVGKIEHDNPADYFNTCLKMAKKRAHIDAIITATSASDIFTQDIEDMVDKETSISKPEPEGEKDKPVDKKSTTSTQEQFDKELTALRKTIHANYSKCNVTKEEYKQFLKAKYGVETSLNIANKDELLEILKYFNPESFNKDDFNDIINPVINPVPLTENGGKVEDKVEDNQRLAEMREKVQEMGVEDSFKETLKRIYQVNITTDLLHKPEYLKDCIGLVDMLYKYWQEKSLDTQGVKLELQNLGKAVK